ncbi:MAG TPA: ABC transporter permease [Bryobacteraceae bacterium]|nr:ABC transporter permease [Bryobacteraceae bacterium]
MTRYLGRRLFRASILLLAVSALSFCLFQLVPGDYYDELRMDPAVSRETIAELRKQHSLHEPMAIRYGRWLMSIAKGEWGYSVAYNIPLGPLLFGRALNTLILTSSAALCAWAIAVPFALWTVGGGRWRHLLATSLTSVLLSFPDLVVLLALLALAANSGILPAGGMSSPQFSQMTLPGKTADLILHLSVPVAALALGSLPTLLLHTRSALIEAMRSPFVRFAVMNGIPHTRIMIRHAMPAAANPMISLLGLSVGSLLSSSLVVEAVVGWPGLGHLLFQALMQRDLLAVAGAILLSSLFLIAGNLIADILLYALDPRIRHDRK